MIELGGYKILTKEEERALHAKVDPWAGIAAVVTCIVFVLLIL